MYASVMEIFLHLLQHLLYTYISIMTGRWPFTSGIISQELDLYLHSPTYLATMTGRWPFSRKTKNDHEASGSMSEARRRMSPPPLPRMAPTQAAPSPRAPPRRSASRAPRDRVYVRLRQARRLYAHGETVPWPDVNLPARWLLNSRHVPVPPVLRKGPEHVQEICKRRALLLMHLRRDPSFAIALPTGTHSRPGNGTDEDTIIDHADFDCLSWKEILSLIDDYYKVNSFLIERMS
jgi:hypothetical protein